MQRDVLTENDRIPVIIDSDANNELDDQHAIAYLLFNGDAFDIKGVTVNRTLHGGGIDEHVAEARRVVRLAGAEESVPVISGASGSFEEIVGHLDEDDYDGHEAVEFIIDKAHEADDEPLVLLPVGKLTNIALALERDPSIADDVRIVWLGSNYPEPGEYNQDNDIGALQYVLEQDVPFEIVTVRYGKPSGTSAVRVTPDEVQENLVGLGPRLSQPVEGRHGGEFYTFGDYSGDLFDHAELHGDPPSRALFDLAAVAIVKNPNWAESRIIPAPELVNEEWRERPENPREIVLWENFDRDAIIEDFYESMQDPALP